MNNILVYSCTIEHQWFRQRVQIIEKVLQRSSLRVRTWTRPLFTSSPLPPLIFPLFLSSGSCYIHGKWSPDMNGDSVHHHHLLRRNALPGHTHTNLHFKIKQEMSPCKAHGFVNFFRMKRDVRRIQSSTPNHRVKPRYNTNKRIKVESTFPPLNGQSPPFPIFLPEKISSSFGNFDRKLRGIPGPPIAGRGEELEEKMGKMTKRGEERSCATTKIQLAKNIYGRLLLRGSFTYFKTRFWHDDDCWGLLLSQRPR